MNKHDLLKLRIRRYVSLAQLKGIAKDYLPEGSVYFEHPEHYKVRGNFLVEFENCHLVENNYDSLLARVNVCLLK